MYIHGGDFSTYPMQQEAQRLAQGLNLQIGASFAGNEQSNTGNSGNGIVTVTQIMWIGSTTSTSCVAVGATNCTNHDSFVYTQQIQFGNGTLASANTVTVGHLPDGCPEQFGRCAELHHRLPRRAGWQRPVQYARASGNPAA